MKPLLLALSFWLLASVLMTACSHHPDCLCDECYSTYAKQWTIDHEEELR